jgi:hypothetical protein
VISFFEGTILIIERTRRPAGRHESRENGMKTAAEADPVGAPSVDNNRDARGIGPVT